MASSENWFSYYFFVFLCAVCGFFFCVRPSSLGAAQDQRAILQLIVNRVEKGEILVLISAPDVMARVSDLERAGLRNFYGKREAVRGEAYVSLSSLAPDVAFEMDEKALALRLTAEPVLLGSTVLDLRQGRPRNILYSRDTSGFFNYAINWQDFNQYDAFGEAGLSVGGNLIFSSLSRNADGLVSRGLTNVTLDDRQNLRRWAVGDSVASAGGLGGSLFFGGVSVSREFSLDPYFYRYPSTGLSATVQTPSTADLYVNGLLVRREQLAPGQIELKNLPVSTGSGLARVVIRDAFGREREILSPFYFTPGILSQGLHEYSYNLGYRRNNLGIDSWDYGPLGFLGRHRVGLTNDLTGGLRLEAGSGMISGGSSMTFRLPVGEIELSAAASRKKGLQGGAAFLGYSYLGRWISLGGSLRTLSPRYANLGLEPLDERPWLETSVFGGIQLGSWTNLSLQHTFSNSQSQGTARRVSLSSSTRLLNQLSLFVAGGQRRESGKNVSEAFVGLTYFFGETVGGVSYQKNGDSGTKTFDLQKSLPLGAGFGYRFQAAKTDEEDARLGGALQYQGPYGRYEASYSRSNGQGTTLLNVTGGLAAIGGDFYFSRPVQDGFALIRVPDVKGVRGYANNQEIGSTNSRGDLLVPNLLSYYGNRLSIADQDVPMDRSVAGTEKTIAPPFRGGAVVTFPVGLLQSFTGTVLLEASGQTATPAYGQLTVKAGEKEFESPVGKQGQFYLENVPPGNHPAVLEYRETACRFTMEIPASPARFVALGTLRCVAH